MNQSAEGHWKYYFDPAISLLITCIIFSSALPLGESNHILAQSDYLQAADYLFRTCVLQSKARVISCCKVCHRISPLKRSGMLSSLVLELFLFTRLVFQPRTCVLRRLITTSLVVAHLATVREDRCRVCPCHGQP